MISVENPLKQNTGDDIEKIIRTYKTPFYLYHENVLKDTCERIREMLPGISLCFAMKAAPVLTGVMDRYADRLEVCSPGEFEICQRAGIAPEKILVSGVNKSPENVQRFLECAGEKAGFTIESERHLRLLEEGAKSSGRKLNCYIRLSSGNQFGVDRDEFLKILDAVEASQHLTFTGVHFFSGTQKTSNRIEKELNMLTQFGAKIEKQTGRKAELEYGPGLSISYFETKKKELGTEEISEDQAITDQSKVAMVRESEETIQKLSDSVKSSGIRDGFSGITFEYGRFLAAKSADYYTAVADLKQTEGTNYAILEGGIHQVAYYGSMSGMKVPHLEVISLTENDGNADMKKETGDYVLAGSLCSVNDILARSASLPILSIGDVIRFPLSGAYALTEVPALFLSRDLPAILLSECSGNTRKLRDHMETNGINDGSVALSLYNFNVFSKNLDGLSC
ncbi:MAG: alanine racemase [Lachnospiraceae bacterium]|nr:alanine racemase [Lachnospiraceae bacterium]